MFAQQVVNAFVASGILALTALGLTLTYGVLRFLNVAHGELIMAGGYIGLVLVTLTGNLLLSFIGSIVGVMLIAVAMERLTFRYVRDQPHFVPLLMSLGLTTVMTEIVRMIFYPARPTAFPESVQAGGSVSLGLASISTPQLLVLGIALGMTLLLHLLIFHSKVGLALRAMSENLSVARLLGINDDRMASVTFAIAGALSGAAGICFGLLYASIDPYIGGPLGLKGVMVIVFAGLGNMWGALLGALLFGLAGVMSVAYLAPGWSDFFAYLFVVLVLIFRPRGVFGTPYEQPR